MTLCRIQLVWRVLVKNPFVSLFIWKFEQPSIRKKYFCVINGYNFSSTTSGLSGLAMIGRTGASSSDIIQWQTQDTPFG